MLNVPISLPDVQKLKSGFPEIALDRVGVRKVRAPFYFVTSDRSYQVFGTFSLYCNLTSDLKGINMSRMARTLYDIVHNANLSTLESLVCSLKKAHQTDNIYARCWFELPYTDKTPRSEIKTSESLPILLESTLVGDQLKNYMQIYYTGMSLCPCSREMSLLKNNLSPSEFVELSNASLSANLREKINLAGFGAHNQKSHVEIKVELRNTAEIIDVLLDIASGACSSTVWSALKREDEKYITELSYMGGYIDENFKFIKVNHTSRRGAKFVEDIARDAAEMLNKLLDLSINDYVIVVNNEESIHSNEIVATAILSAGRNLK